MRQQREQWTSKLGFILATAGSAIGLGAIWKFPYVAGTAGGGAFLLVFLLFTLMVGLPILLAEFIIGRGSQQDAVHAYAFFAPKTKWHWIGYLGVITCIILLSFYSVVGGWIIIYLLKAVVGGLSLLGIDQYEQIFGGLISNPWIAVLGQATFMLITIIVVAKGVRDGIERASKVMMPALFISFLVLIIRSLTLDGVGEGLVFFLYPNISELNSEVILFALGQSFFALSVGVSVMVTYSSYVSKEESLPKSALSIVLMNILISILAGLAIFPAVFSFGFEPTEGPGLLFIVLPAVFANMPFGTLFLIIFLLLFLFATLTSAFSMLEILVAVFTRKKPVQRKKVAWVSGLFILLLGIPSALSFGVLGDITLFDKSIFDLADYLVSNILMPVGALLISIFAFRKIPKETLLQEISAGTSNGKRLFAIWYFLIRFIAPVAIIVVFLDVIGVLRIFSK